MGSAGRARPGIEVDIVGSNSESLPRGEVGELVVRGPSVMSGYLNRPEATAETIVDGWLHTGDLGRMTESGFIYLLDRAKDMIITGGTNVYPAEIEAVLLTHPKISDVGVIGIPDPEWGESIVAIVQLKSGFTASEELNAELLQFCKEHLASYKCPRRWDYRTELPRTEAGKLYKRKIRDEYLIATKNKEMT